MQADTTTDPRAVRKALILGLDGADWQIIDPLMARGELPNLARLIGQGVRAPLRSTVPAITFAAWPSMITGMNPGRHGIYSFWKVDAFSYEADRVLLSSRPIAGQTLFDHLGSLGLRVCAFHVPMTYPVWPVNGAMVAGFPTPDMGKAFCYPPELAEWVPPPLPSEVDQEHVGPEGAIRNPSEYIDRLTTTMERFLADDQFHFYMMVENLTDFACHRFWKLYDPTFPTYDAEMARKRGNPLAESYRQIDACIGRLLPHVPDDWVVVVASDHGSGRGPTKWFHTNAWLLRQGLLQPARVGRARAARAGLWLIRRVVRANKVRSMLFRLLPKRGARRIERVRSLVQAVDWAATKAYMVRLEPQTGGIMINVRGRQPSGLVEPGDEYEQLRSQLEAGLRQLCDPETGRPLVTEVRRREEVYHGPFLEKAPDLVFHPDPDYRLGERLDLLVAQQDRAFLSRSSGAHRRDGVLALRAPGVFRQAADLERAEIVDVVPTLYHAMGLPVPTDADGVVLLDAFEPAYLAAHPVQTAGTLATGPVQGDGTYSEQEEEGVRLALKGLGYIE